MIVKTKTLNTIQVSPAQYATMRGTKNKSAINRAIRNNWDLKGVMRVDKYGSSFTVMTVLINAKGELIDVEKPYDIYQF